MLFRIHEVEDKILLTSVLLSFVLAKMLPSSTDNKKTSRSSSQAAPLSTAHGGGFTLSILILNIMQRTCKNQVLNLLV